MEPDGSSCFLREVWFVIRMWLRQGRTTGLKLQHQLTDPNAGNSEGNWVDAPREVSSRSARWKSTLIPSRPIPSRIVRTTNTAMSWSVTRCPPMNRAYLAGVLSGFAGGVMGAWLLPYLSDSKSHGMMAAA